MNNRYSISNDMSERPISRLKEKFSVSESHEIKYDSENAYCLLMNEIETDNLYQDDELNNKFMEYSQILRMTNFLEYIYLMAKARKYLTALLRA
jgi:hypothetical protein